MNIKLLKAFVMLAKTGNYRESAQALYMTQPALTKQINLLESRLNIRLFSRGRHGAILTPSGQQLLAQAEKMVNQSELFLQHAARVAKGIEGFLAIGFGLSTFYLAPTLSQNSGSNSLTWRSRWRIFPLRSKWRC